jgi:putative endonuclease
MTNKYNNVLYTGVTNDLQRRVIEHKTGKAGSFTKKYKLSKLVYYESGDNIELAIQREKEIKGGSRKKKIELVNSINPDWQDLFDKYFV